MSKQLNVITINGITYYSPKSAADNWQMSYQAATSACKDGRIVGAFQDSTKHWCIPDTATKPIEKETIRKILIITLMLKNDPNINIPDIRKYDIPKLYKYLRDIGYINQFNEDSHRIPYEAILTDKGMKLVIENKKIDINLSNIAIMFIQCIPSFLEIGATLIH